VSFLDFWKGYYRGWGCKKVQDYTENVRKNKPKTTKPQSEKSKLTPSNIVKPKQKRQNDWRRRQALVYNHLHNLAHVTFMSVRIQNWQTLMMKQLQGQKNAVSVQFTPDPIPSAEYGVIVRNLILHFRLQKFSWLFLINWLNK